MKDVEWEYIAGSVDDLNKFLSSVDKKLRSIGKLFRFIEAVVALGIFLFVTTMIILVKEQGLSAIALMAISGIILGIAGILSSIIGNMFAIVAMEISLGLSKLPELFRLVKKGFLEEELGKKRGKEGGT